MMAFRKRALNCDPVAVRAFSAIRFEANGQPNHCTSNKTIMIFNAQRNITSCFSRNHIPFHPLSNDSSRPATARSG